jgi:hypothetical protein
MKTTADCCSKPRMILLEVLEDKFGDNLTVKRCATCQTNWLVIAERVSNTQGEIIEWESYRRLTAAQAEELMADAVA